MNYITKSLLLNYQKIWIVSLAIGYALILNYFSKNMDIYEQFILPTFLLVLIFSGYKWKNIIWLVVAVVFFTLLSIYLYDSSIENNQINFFLKYFLASQSAIMWMSFLLIFTTAIYFFYLINKNNFIGNLATSFTWFSTCFGLVGMMVRWYESYLINPEYGHIPISNLYEVFILFITTNCLIYLYYEKKFKIKTLGGFVMLINFMAIVFLLWYSFSKEAHIIQPLVPALNSYWMKIHVPTNFIGYGCFSIAAMISIAFLIKNKFFESSNLFTASNEIFETIVYRLISLGFIFFTIATILGAIWAAEAWGSYWSWDPKETWALIVWLNYAAWLHSHLNKNFNMIILSWWNIIGLFITLFAFLGVNMFLSGLHSYGEL